ncbi:MAG: right-handed parallel beta-helix repeat-containing protein, partial [Candidatus Krumholzibacteriia bacterium]
MLNPKARGALVVAFLVASCARAVAHPASSHGDHGSWFEGYTLFLLEEGADLHAARRLVQSQGGTVALMLPPRVLTGWIDPRHDARLVGRAGIRSIHREPLAAAPSGVHDRASLAALRFFGRGVRGRLGPDVASKPAAAHQYPPGSDVFLAGDVSELDVLRNLERSGPEVSRKLGSANSVTANSDYMVGTVTLSLFFVESDGSGADPDLYDWTSSAEDEIYDEVVAGLSWWSDQASQHSDCWVTFLVQAYYSTEDARCSQWREPVTRSSSEFRYVVRDVLDNFGYASGSHTSQATAHNYAQRQRHGTDWAYSAFVVPNPAGPTSFTDGFAAWAYLGGPYTALLQHSFNWSFRRVFAHESAHIFGACDEYYVEGYGGCGDCDECWTTGVDNGNCEKCNENSVSCMMKANTWSLCEYTPGQIGWWRSPCTAEQLPAPIVSSIHPQSMLQGDSGEIIVAGENLNFGSSVDLGAGVDVRELERLSPQVLRLTVDVDLEATPGTRDLVLTGPDGQSVTLPESFSVASTPVHFVASWGSDTYPYDTPATAARSLAAGIAAASSGDTLRLMGGIYEPVVIDKSIVLEGGWSNDFVSRYPAELPSILEQTGSGPVMVIRGAGTSPTIDGLVLRGGTGQLVSSPQLGSAFSGGGVLCFDASPTLRNCILEDNRAGTPGVEGAGGGAFFWGADVTLERCTFRRNRSGRGSGVYVLDGTAHLDGNLFELNQADPALGPAWGGGIALLDSEIDMRGDVLRDNTGATRGGALHADTCARVELVGVRLQGHQVSGTGGALWAQDSNVGLRSCDILENGCGDRGGGIHLTGGALTIESSVLAANTAAVLGGGLHATSATAILHNVTVARNTGGPASGIYLHDTPAGCEIANSVVAHNTIGGIVLGAGEPPRVDWNAFWENAGLDVLGGGLGPNDAQVDPRFTDLDGLDLHLGAHSQCIDSGDPALRDPDDSRSDRGAYGGPLARPDAPPAIQGLDALMAGSAVRLTWYPSTAADVASYLVYRAAAPDFRPAASNHIAEIQVPEGSFLDASPTPEAWYVVTAVFRNPILSASFLPDSD